MLLIIFLCVAVSPNLALKCRDRSRKQAGGESRGGWRPKQRPEDSQQPRVIQSGCGADRQAHRDTRQARAEQSFNSVLRHLTPPTLVPALPGNKKAREVRSGQGEHRSQETKARGRQQAAARLGGRGAGWVCAQRGVHRLLKHLIPTLAASSLRGKTTRLHMVCRVSESWALLPLQLRPSPHCPVSPGSLGSWGRPRSWLSPRPPHAIPFTGIFLPSSSSPTISIHLPG